MRQLSIIILAALFSAVSVSSCNANHKSAEVKTENAVKVQQPVEILYFHGKQRCITCIAIENEMTLEQLQEVVFPHPTVSEIIKETAFTLK